MFKIKKKKHNNVITIAKLCIIFININLGKPCHANEIKKTS